MKKVAYERPSLNKMGSFEALTKGGSSSGAIDAQFPVGTVTTIPFS